MNVTLILSGITLFVKTLPGQTHAIVIDPSDTIEHLKNIIQNITGDLLDHQRLVFAGKFLENNRICSDYGKFINDILARLFFSRELDSGPCSGILLRWFCSSVCLIMVYVLNCSNVFKPLWAESLLRNWSDQDLCNLDSQNHGHL